MKLASCGGREDPEHLIAADEGPGKHPQPQEMGQDTGQFASKISTWPFRVKLLTYFELTVCRVFINN